MEDVQKTKDQLVAELAQLRECNLKLENVIANCGLMSTNVRNSNCKLMVLIENMPGMGYACLNDTDWTMQFVSKGSIEVTGYRPEDFIENNVISFNDIIYPDDRRHVWDQVQEALTQQRKYRLLYRILTSSGDLKWVWEQGVGVFSREGRLLSLQGFINAVAS